MLVAPQKKNIKVELHTNVLAAQSVYFYISLSMQDPSKNILYPFRLNYLNIP